MNTETQKIGSLRPMTNNDLEMVLEWRNAPGVRKNMYTQGVISLAEHREWWAKTEGSKSDEYLIFEAEGAPRGVVSFMRIDTTHETADWGFYASPSAQKGTGSRMGFGALEYAFNHLCLNKICGEALAFNTGSLSLHKSLGFKEEGLFKAQKKIDGAFIDVYRLAIFAADWAQKRSQLLEKLSRRA